MRFLTTLLLCMLLFLPGVAQLSDWEPTDAEYDSAVKTVTDFMQAALDGKTTKAVSLCDYEVQDGSGTGFPANLVVSRLVQFLQTRSVQAKKILFWKENGTKTATGDYLVKETGKTLRVSLQMLKGGKWYVTHVILDAL